VVTIKETSLEVNAEKSKYMFLSSEDNTGKYHKVKTGNRFCEDVEQFKYFGRTLRIVHNQPPPATQLKHSNLVD
jgi:hypothetical protein